MNALPVQECTHGDEVNIRNNEIQEISKVGVIPSAFIPILGLRLALKDTNNHAAWWGNAEVCYSYYNITQNGSLANFTLDTFQWNILYFVGHSG